MSRLAKKPVLLPKGVTVTVSDTTFKVEGPLGKLEHEFKPEFVEVKVEENGVYVNRKGDANEFKAYQGLYWAHLRNAVVGVSEGFKKVLKIMGVGYKWQLQGNKLVCNVGLSHSVEFIAPEGIKLSSDNPALLTVSGIDKRLVGQTAANIRFIKPPESYKGKGIRYENEVVRLKEGKAGAK